MLTKINHGSFVCIYCILSKTNWSARRDRKENELMGATIGKKMNYLIKQMLPENAGTSLINFDEKVTDL